MGDERSTNDGLSRRSALKRIGAGAAIAWTAPAMLSIDRAFAAGSAPCSGCATNPCGFRPFAPCGPECLCAQKADGSCACVVPFCTGPCNTDADCSPGQVCGFAPCCGANTCAFECGGPRAPAKPAQPWAHA